MLVWLWIALEMRDERSTCVAEGRSLAGCVEQMHNESEERGIVKGTKSHVIVHCIRQFLRALLPVWYTGGSRVHFPLVRRCRHIRSSRAETPAIRHCVVEMIFKVLVGGLAALMHAGLVRCDDHGVHLALRQHFVSYNKAA